MKLLRQLCAGALGLALSGIAVRARAADGNPTPFEASSQLGAVEHGVQSAEEQLVLVERSYVERLTSGAVETLEERFGKGELYFLLQDYVAASVLLFDVVLTPQFRSSQHYVDGVYYLGESLYRQKDYLGGKRFLQQVIEAGPGKLHFDDALSRYLELAAKTNDYRQIDRFLQIARSGGKVSAGVQYLLGKAAYERRDLSTRDRLDRTIGILSQIPPGPHFLQARYFIGACHVELGDLPKASGDFQSIVRSEGQLDATEESVRQLAWLALGRVDYELGKYSEALDAYQEIPESAADFNDALFEIAWTYVKKADYENAGKAVDLILLGAPEGKLTPEANLLKGHLLLKLKKYAEAEETYNAVINRYAPVRDEIDALLRVHADPAAYFEELLAAKGKAFDVTTLLPPVAQQWATSQRDVAEAQEVVTDLQESQAGIAESHRIVERLNQRIASAGTMEAFPALQAGFARTAAVDASLLGFDRQLVALEQGLVGPYLTLESRQALAAAQSRRASLQARFDALPKTTAEIDARRGEMVGRLQVLDRDLFKLSLTVQSERAQLVAVRQMQLETAPNRPVKPAEEGKFSGDVQQELAGLDALDVRVAKLRRDLKDDEALAGGAGSTGDTQLRQAYAAAVQAEADLLARALDSAGGQAGELAQRVKRLHAHIDELRKRDAAALEIFRRSAITQADVIRQKIAIETQNLSAYDQEVAATQGVASGLVGKIAFGSFRQVRKSFYDLVLKADVGIIDLAWTRKRDETDKIQKLASDEDRELRVLDDEFKEVLGDVK